MRKRYSFSSRRTGQAKDAKNIKKQKPKFPEVVEKLIKESEIILQILDARFIDDTRNLEIEKYLKDKRKKLINVINKSDLAQIKYIKPRLIPYVVTSCKKRTGIKQLREKIKTISKQIKKEKVIVGIIGYPNTGKSSLINLLIGKKSAGTGAEAGYTKGLQKLKLDKKILLFDSPGVIPKEEYTSVKNKKLTKHVKVGARTWSHVRNAEQIVAELIKEFPNILQNKYKIQTKSPEHLLEKLGRKKNFLKKGNEVDIDRTAKSILKDWQDGKIKI